SIPVMSDGVGHGGSAAQVVGPLYLNPRLRSDLSPMRRAVPGNNPLKHFLFPADVFDAGRLEPPCPTIGSRLGPTPIVAHGREEATNSGASHEGNPHPAPG